MLVAARYPRPTPARPAAPLAITIAGGIPGSEAHPGFPLEEAVAPDGLCAAVLAAGDYLGHPDGRGRSSRCLPPSAGRSHLRTRTQPRCAKPDNSAPGPPLQHKFATDR